MSPTTSSSLPGASLIPPSRRDVRGMTRLLDELEQEAQVSALFKDDLYGIFRISGTPFLSPSTGLLLIGGRTMASGGKPDKELLALEVLQESMQTPSGETVDSTQVTHGEFVIAEVEQSPYGLFSVEGQVVETASGNLALLGHWFLRNSDGTAAHRIRHLVARHHQNIPAVPRITTWRDEES